MKQKEDASSINHQRRGAGEKSTLAFKWAVIIFAALSVIVHIAAELLDDTKGGAAVAHFFTEWMPFLKRAAMNKTEHIVSHQIYFGAMIVVGLLSMAYPIFIEFFHQVKVRKFTRFFMLNFLIGFSAICSLFLFTFFLLIYYPISWTTTGIKGNVFLSLYWRPIFGGGAVWSVAVFFWVLAIYLIKATISLVEKSVLPSNQTEE
ncbi:hypothetical protein D3870_18590 [Noviherbaspirillum cavernae]|uniref:Uncharacterized protein n=2 Tax=Noviherbaspirillum cavernae TaxID=2320862 RepID=A0A418WUV2_9BURK|nr:hypothetical protein D3870_18590 [Noviherbaspirillum cavernae]